MWKLYSDVFCSVLSNDSTTVTTWATGTNDVWDHLKKGFKHLSVEYAALGDKASQEVGHIGKNRGLSGDSCDYWLQ